MNQQRVDWKAKGLKILRLSCVRSSYNECHVDNCTGVLNGEIVKVDLPFTTLPFFEMKKSIVIYAKIHQLYAAGTGILNSIVVTEPCADK